MIMDVHLKIKLILNRNLKFIYFGVPNNILELDEMYRFRYRIYLENNYISPNNSKKDIDRYDKNKSIYFIATVDNRIIGSARLIKDYYLPTEKDCFHFEEPLDMKHIPRDQRVEVSRLIVEKYDKEVYFPRHLVMLGLFYTIMQYAKRNGFRAGYSFIKESLVKKLDKMQFPYHKIEKFTQVYKSGTLQKYFNDEKNPVIPIYYMIDEIAEYLDGIFNNKLLFKKENSNVLCLRSGLLWKFINLFIL